MALVDSENRYFITIIRPVGTFSDGSTQMEPMGTPFVGRDWNRGDQVFVEITPKQRNSTIELNISEITRGDRLQLTIDGFPSFFGEIIDIDEIRQENKTATVLTAWDFLARADERQLDRVIYNDYRDLEPRVVTAGKAQMKGRIQPLAAAFAVDRQGLFVVERATPIPASAAGKQNITRDVAGSATSDENAVMFNPRSGSRTITKLWFNLGQYALSDRIDAVSPATYNKVLVTTPLAVDVQTVQLPLQSEHFEPTGTVVKRRSGADASFAFRNDAVEDYSGVTAGGTLYQGTGSGSGQPPGTNLGWDVDNAAGSPSSGGSGVNLWSRTQAGADIGFTGFSDTVAFPPGDTTDYLPYSHVVYDGTNAVRLTTTFPNSNHHQVVGGREERVSDSGWVFFDVHIPQKDSRVDVYLDVSDGVLGNAKRWAWLQFRDDASLRLFHGDIATSAGQTIAGGYGSGNTFTGPIFQVAFKVDIKRMRWDVYIRHTDRASVVGSGLFLWLAGSPPPPSEWTTLGTELRPYTDFLGTTGLFEFDRIARYSVEMNTGAAGTVDVGLVNGNEIGLSETSEVRGLGNGDRWCQLDISADPIDVDPDEMLSLRLFFETDTVSGGQALRIRWKGLLPTTTSLGPKFQFSITNDGHLASPTWFNSRADAGTNFEFMFMVEYGPDSLVSLSEERDFVVNYDTGEIDLDAGELITRKVNDSLRLVPFISNPAFFPSLPPNLFQNELPTLKASEINNPSAGGVIVNDREMRVNDVVKHLATLVPGGLWAVPIVDGTLNDLDDDPTANGGLGEGFAAIRLDSFTVRQRSVLVALRDLAERYKAILSISPNTNFQLLFQAVKTIGGINIFSPGAHEYVLTTDEKAVPPNTDFARVISHDVGQVDSGVFTTFRVVGADASIQTTKHDETLAVKLGRRMEAPVEVFTQETHVENLELFADAMRAVFGIQVVEGTITVEGYFPIGADSKLDINGLVKLVDPTVPGGDDITAGGISNVFKIHSLQFNGETNSTQIFVSNRDLFRVTESRLIELRNLMNGIQPTVPLRDESLLGVDPGAGLDSGAAASDDLFMGLLVDDGAGGVIELTPALSIGYIRQPTRKWVQQDTDVISYSAFWPAGVGTIPNDRLPIKEVRLYTDQIGGSQVSGTTGVSLPVADHFYKWTNVRLHFTYNVTDTD
jgi:hypothetical protein